MPEPQDAAGVGASARMSEEDFDDAAEDVWLADDDKFAAALRTLLAECHRARGREKALEAALRRMSNEAVAEYGAGPTADFTVRRVGEALGWPR